MRNNALAKSMMAGLGAEQDEHEWTKMSLIVDWVTSRQQGDMAAI